MTQIIYKYPLLINNHQFIAMPGEARILSVQVQDGQIQMWALVADDRKPLKSKSILMYGTGHPVDNDPKRYIGTVQDGVFVWHYFEELEEGF